MTGGKQLTLFIRLPVEMIARREEMEIVCAQYYPWNCPQFKRTHKRTENRTNAVATANQKKNLIVTSSRAMSIGHYSIADYLILGFPWWW